MSLSGTPSYLNRLRASSAVPRPSCSPTIISCAITASLPRQPWSTTGRVGALPRGAARAAPGVEGRPGATAILSPMTDENPFFETWTPPFGVPPFDRIRPEHFPPAFDRGMAEEQAEVAAIAGPRGPPTFANTIAALERSGRLLARVSNV